MHSPLMTSHEAIDQNYFCVHLLFYFCPFACFKSKSPSETGYLYPAESLKQGFCEHVAHMKHKEAFCEKDQRLAMMSLPLKEQVGKQKQEGWLIIVVLTLYHASQK